MRELEARWSARPEKAPRAKMSQAVIAEAYDALRRAEPISGRRADGRADSGVDGGVAATHVDGAGAFGNGRRGAGKRACADPPPPRIVYGLGSTTPEVDDAYLKFMRARRCAVAAAQTENAVRRLARSVRSAKKRVGALSGIVIPRLEAEIALIASALEERERDSFTSLKVIKRRGESK